MGQLDIIWLCEIKEIRTTRLVWVVVIQQKKSQIRQLPLPQKMEQQKLDQQPSHKHPIDLQNSQSIRDYILNYTRNKKVNGLKVLTLHTNFYHKQLKKTKLLLDLPNLDKIIDAPPDSKIILVDSLFNIASIQLFKNTQGQTDTHWQLVTHETTLTYKVLSTQELFDLFTGSKIPFPNSFQTVGHLAHYNLTAEQIPYHKVIGEITLLKCLNITCVVNKTQKLHNVYRTPTLEMMAGVQNYLVRLKEVGTFFELDFQKVYWCSRLQQERDRLLKMMNEGECLVDIFCGCGPLAVRAARKGLYVIANDLNPYGYEYLVHNAKLNHVSHHMICSNMCAREVVRKLYRQKLTLSSHFQQPDHIYMNLPVDAIEFLDVFTNYAKDMNTQKMPLVHVNCFVVADSEEKSRQLLAERISKTLIGFREDNIIQMNHIKNVTIIMRMYCITFRLSQKYDEKKGDENNGHEGKEANLKVNKDDSKVNDVEMKQNGDKKVKLG